MIFIEHIPLHYKYSATIRKQTEIWRCSPAYLFSEILSYKTIEKIKCRYFPSPQPTPIPEEKRQKINVTIYRLQTTGLLQNHTCPVLLSHYTEPGVSYVQYSGGTPSVRKWICTTDQTHRRRHIISTDTGMQYESITSLVQTEGLQYRTVKNAQGVVGGCISGK